MKCSACDGRERGFSAHRKGDGSTSKRRTMQTLARLGAGASSCHVKPVFWMKLTGAAATEDVWESTGEAGAGGAEAEAGGAGARDAGAGDAEAGAGAGSGETDAGAGEAGAGAGEAGAAGACAKRLSVLGDEKREHEKGVGGGRTSAPAATSSRDATSSISDARRFRRGTSTEAVEWVGEGTEEAITLVLSARFALCEAGAAGGAAFMHAHENYFCKGIKSAGGHHRLETLCSSAQRCLASLETCLCLCAASVSREGFDQRKGRWRPICLWRTILFLVLCP